MRIPTCILGLFFLSVLTTAGVAGALEDGEEALNAGDYATALKLLKPLAEEGNPAAQFFVGDIYMTVVGLGEDQAGGLGWVRKAASQGFARAQGSIGRAYLEGRGVEKNYKEAMRWFLKAAEKGDQFSQYSISEMYAEGLGVVKSAPKAERWREKARRPPQLPKEVAEGLAQISSITLYSLQPRGGPDIPEWDFHGHHILGRCDLPPEQTKTAIAALNAAISAGRANSYSMCIFNPRHALAFKSGGDTYDILICYQCGQLQVLKNDEHLPFGGSIGGKPGVLNALLKASGIPLADTPVALQKSYAAEAKVALEMAEAGDPKAQNVIGRMLMRGKGVKRNDAEGIRWLAKSQSVTQDDPSFQVSLGKMYEAGFEVQKDEAKALKLYQQAATQGSTDALCELASCHEYGAGVPKNLAEANKLYLQAAESGNSKAQFWMGVRTARGWGFKQSYDEAMKWFRKAAEQSNPSALDWISEMYKEGWGVPKDPMEAYFWDQLAVAYKTTSGDRVSFEPSPEQRIAVQKRIADWIATHPKRSGN